MAKTVTDPSAGEICGNYMLTHELDEDDHSRLFQALHRTLRHPVALRVPKAAWLASQFDVRKELLDKARLLAPLTQPHLVRLLDYEDSGPAPLIVFEYVKGLSLRQLIRQSGRLRWDRGVRLLTQLAGALAAIWQAGMRHGRLSPGQVLIAPEGFGKLSFRGHVLLPAPRADDDCAYYFAPEQAEHVGPIDHQADIFALGVLGYEILTGQRPFTTTDRKNAPRKLHEIAVDVPARVSELIHRMMALEARDRVDRSSTLLHELQMIRLPGWSAAD
jgi:serine/threonine-protein kinase